MSKQRQNQRLEQTIRKKLKKGWNAFNREEMEAMVALLAESRQAKHRLRQRIHTSHGDAIGWTYEDSIGLHANRPAPEGAINLFAKPRALAFEPGWRVPEGVKIRGFVRTKDGEIFMRRRKPGSPNDLMREMHLALTDLSTAYRIIS